MYIESASCLIYLPFNFATAQVFCGVPVDYSIAVLVKSVGKEVGNRLPKIFENCVQCFIGVGCTENLILFIR